MSPSIRRWSVALACLAALGPVRSATAQSYKNVVMIVLDDPGAERFEFWPTLFPNHPPEVPNGGYPSLPNLELLAENGIRYTNFWVNPVCSATRAALMTGRHGHRTGVGQVIRPADAFALSPAGEKLLPQLLKDTASYNTGLFGKWHLSGAAYTTNMLELGFDIFQGSMGNVDNYFHWLKTSSFPTSSGWASTQTMIGSSSTSNDWDWSGVHTRQDASNWIQGVAGLEDPYFACVCFSPPHSPWQVPPTNLLSPAAQAAVAAENLSQGDIVLNTDPDQELRGMIFNWMLEAVDSQIGQLIADIAKTGTLCDTLFVVLSDNGSPRKVLSPGPSVYNPEHGKASPYNLGTKVPLIVTCGSALAKCKSDCPDKTWGESGPWAQDDRLISVVDLWRTVPIMAGVPASAINSAATGLTLDSIDFTSSTRSLVLIERFDGFMPHSTAPAMQYRRAVTDGKVKFVLQNWDVLTHDEGEFFDLIGNEIEDLDCNLIDEALCTFDMACTCSTLTCDTTLPCSTPASCSTQLLQLRQALIDWLGSCP